MNPLAIALPLLLSSASAMADAEAVASSTHTAVASTWSAHLDVIANLVPDDPYVTPVARGDRGPLHLEGRYQYEDRRTASAWAGWNLGTGSTLRLDIVPMMGIVGGGTNGCAPGVEITVSWKRLSWYSENEYVFDVEGKEGDFFYVWSQLGWEAKPWLEPGLAIQRTRVYQSEFSVDRGIYGLARRGRYQLSAYGFNFDGEHPFAILELGVDF